MKYRSTREVRRQRRHFLCRLWRRKPYNRPGGRWKCVPLWWLAPPPFPRSSVGRQKESALMGRLGALLRPTWRSYAEPPQGTTTRAYCRARKCTPFGGWRHHLPPGGGTITRAYCRAIYRECFAVFYSAPWTGGSPAQPERGWRAKRANQQKVHHAI